ncbi:hypothetical protein ACSBR1_006594 [Camellia fascicularis]
MRLPPSMHSVADCSGSYLGQCLIVVHHNLLHSYVVSCHLAWFPFFLFDSDWMGREAYRPDPKGDVSRVQTYDQGARAATFDFLLNSVTSCVPFSVTAELTADTGDDQAF